MCRHSLGTWWKGEGLNVSIVDAKVGVIFTLVIAIDGKIYNVCLIVGN